MNFVSQFLRLLLSAERGSSLCTR